MKQTLKFMLKKYAGQNPKHVYLFLLFAYKEVPQVSTGFSPFELLYGRQLHGVLDIIKDGWYQNLESPKNLNEDIMT